MRRSTINETAVGQLIFRHDARNLQLKRRLTERGIDCGSERRVACYFRAPSERQASLLAQELSRRGFSILIRRSAPGAAGGWIVEVGITQSITATASHEFTEDMVRSAAALSCTYEGWGTSIAAGAESC